MAWTEKQKEWYHKNRDRINQRNRERRKNDPGYRKSQNERVQKWAETHKDARRQYQRELYARNEEYRESRRNYSRDYERSPEQIQRIIEKGHCRKVEHTMRAVEMLGGKCAICGRVDHYIAYDFHHIDPSKKSYDVGQKLGKLKWETIVKEVAKCALLCCICHRKFHFGMVVLNGKRAGPSNRDAPREAASTD